MRHPFYLLLLLILLSCIFTLSSCTEKKKPAFSSTKTYDVTFAFVLIPDTLMAEYNGTFRDNFYHFSPEDRQRLAKHVLKNLDQHPSYQLDGHWTPKVRVGHECIIELDTKNNPAGKAFEVRGYRVDRLQMTMRIDPDENSNKEQISCWWNCDSSITNIKKGVGEGGGRPGWPMLVRGVPEMAPIFYKPEGETFWAVVRLD